MKVSVFGAGYVGLVTAACLAEMGNSVVCVDVDAKRVADLQRGISPIHEQGLESLLQRNAAVGRLSFTNDVAAAVSHGTIVFIAVGTPDAEDGCADLQHVFTDAQSSGDHTQGRRTVERPRDEVGRIGNLDTPHTQRASGIEVPQRRAGAAPVGRRCDDHHLVTLVGNRTRQDVDPLRLDSVIVGHQDPHRRRT